MQEQEGSTLTNIPINDYVNNNLSAKILSLLNGTLDGLESLSDWQWTKVANADTDSEARCLLRQWFGEQNSDEGIFCKTKWDHVYCWPPTAAGTVIKLPCSEVFERYLKEHQRNLEGYATRICLSNGTWAFGNGTTYAECVKILQSSEENSEDTELINFVHYMLFYGSIVSLLLLGLAMIILFLFRSVWSERIRIHVQLMLSLFLRHVVYLVLTVQHVLNTEAHYSKNSISCKSALVAHLFATIASVFWMLAQGIYINGKLTTDILPANSRRRLRKFYIIGWLLPIILLLIFVLVMVANNFPGECWEGYADSTEIWIILLPAKVAVAINGLLLLNVSRIVLTKARRNIEQTEFSKVVSIAKMTLFLFPILGLNNLFFLYNPGDDYNTKFYAINIVFGSTQGSLVAIVYFVNCSEVHDAIRRSYSRYQARRSVRSRSIRRRSTRLVILNSTRRLESDNENVDGNVAEEFV